MTPTTEGKQLAADLANAAGKDTNGFSDWEATDFSQGGSIKTAFVRLATEHLALKAQIEEALADLREIDRIAEGTIWSFDIFYKAAARIAAKYRVETDPLDDLLWKALIAWESGDDPDYGERIGTPEGLPAWDAAKAVFRAELSKRGYEIGGKS